MPEALLEQAVIQEFGKTFSIDKTTKNPHFKYLKFVDYRQERTILCFIDDNGKCRMLRYVGGYSYLTGMQDKLNNAYKKKGKDYWEYMVNNVVYSVTLTQKEWFFKIDIVKKD